MSSSKKSVKYMSKTLQIAVVVLGDIGRSPRMQYHALSLSALPNSNTQVELIGYHGKDPHPLVVNSNNIRIHKMVPFPSLPRYLFLFYAILKIFWQAFQLFWVLWALSPKPDFILVQSPPAIPTLFVVRVVAWAKSSKLVIDWHNLGYTLMMMTTHKTPNHPAILFAKWVERTLGRKAYAHLTVTRALKNMLQQEWGVRGEVTVHYDSPPKIFRPFEEIEKETFLQQLATKFPPMKATSNNPHSRSALVVSSTSWTEDEDFGILLDTAKKYDDEADEKSLPPLVLVITGDGPLRLYYEKRIASMGMHNVTILTMWLAAEDYPKILASSDIGISLHTSSSKLDLPMKVVDMLGVGLPVCALTYPALEELLPLDERRGCHFTDSNSLLQLLEDMLQGFPYSPRLSTIRKSIIQDMQDVSWDVTWTTTVAPIFEGKCHK